MTYKRKKYHKGDTHLKKRWRVRNRKRDLDQIDGDLKPENSEALLNQEVDIDKPGDAQFYCIHCANTDVRPILSPRLDLANKFDDLEKLEANIKARGLDHDATGLKSLWQFCNKLSGTRSTLEKRRVEIAAQVKNLKQMDASKSKGEMEKLNIAGRMVRDDLKALLKAYWGAEEKLILGCLELPNDLHVDTPLAKEHVLDVFGTAPSSDGIQTHHSNDLVDIRDPHWYYLKDSAAMFDLALMYYFSDNIKNHGFVRLVPPDFAHSAIVEGCGSSRGDSLSLEPLSDDMNLVGGASIHSFCSYYARQDIPADCLPVRHQVAGKRYEFRQGPGLFGVWQRTCVDIFVLTEDSLLLNSEFSRLHGLLRDLYKHLNWQVRSVYLPAPSLKPWEALRLSFQMKSRNQWVEVGHLSISETYISERLLIEYEKKGKKKGFCHVISGTAVDVTSVLACLLESGTNELFPKPLEPFKLRI